MKPKTKKILIVAFSVAAIVAILWYVVSWRKSPSGIISRLDLSNLDMTSEDEAKLRKYIRAQVSMVQQSFTREEIIHQAENDQLTYNQELVDWACYLLMQIGYFNQPAYEELSRQIKTL